jgi:hypothetical protein
MRGFTYVPRNATQNKSDMIHILALRSYWNQQKLFDKCVVLKYK